MILIAHKNDCPVVTHGPVRLVLDAGNHPVDTEWSPCTCGGIKIRVELAEAHDAITFKLVGRVVDDGEGDR